MKRLWISLLFNNLIFKLILCCPSSKKKDKTTTPLPIEYSDPCLIESPKCANSAAKIPDWMNNFDRIVGGKSAPSPVPWQVHLHLDKGSELNLYIQILTLDGAS